jgi:hypothetical protein
MSRDKTPLRPFTHREMAIGGESGVSMRGVSLAVDLLPDRCEGLKHGGQHGPQLRQDSCVKRRRTAHTWSQRLHAPQGGKHHADWFCNRGCESSTPRRIARTDVTREGCHARNDGMYRSVSLSPTEWRTQRMPVGTWVTCADTFREDNDIGDGPRNPNSKRISDDASPCGCGQ